MPRVNAKYFDAVYTVCNVSHPFQLTNNFRKLIAFNYDTNVFW